MEPHEDKVITRLNLVIFLMVISFLFDAGQKIAAWLGN